MRPPHASAYAAPGATIATGAAISLSPILRGCARHRVCRCLAYPAAQGLDPSGSEPVKVRTGRARLDWLLAEGQLDPATRMGQERPRVVLPKHAHQTTHGSLATVLKQVYLRCFYWALTASSSMLRHPINRQLAGPFNSSGVDRTASYPNTSMTSSVDCAVVACCASAVFGSSAAMNVRTTTSPHLHLGWEGWRKSSRAGNTP